MADLKIKVDAAKIAAMFKEFALEVEQDIRKAMGDLAAITHAKILENSQNELQTTRKIYADNLGFNEVSPGVWVVYLNEKAMWIEEGIEPNHDMKPDLLKGRKYRVIPFKYDKPSSQNSPYANRLISQIKDKLKKEKVPFKKLEYQADGKTPKLGKLHEFNFGGDTPGRGNTPSLQGLSIYQNKDSKGNVRRDILTFRTVSSGPASAGKWIHPGLKAKKYMDAAAEWAMKEFDEKILPEIMEKWK